MPIPRERALVLACTRRERHNPPPIRDHAPIDLGVDQRVLAYSMLETVADLVGVPLPRAMRSLSQTCHAIVVGKLYDQAAAEFTPTPARAAPRTQS